MAEGGRQTNKQIVKCPDDQKKTTSPKKSCPGRERGATNWRPRGSRWSCRTTTTGRRRRFALAQTSSAGWVSSSLGNPLHPLDFTFTGLNPFIVAKNNWTRLEADWNLVRSWAEENGATRFATVGERRNIWLFNLPCLMSWMTISEWHLWGFFLARHLWRNVHDLEDVLPAWDHCRGGFVVLNDLFQNAHKGDHPSLPLHHDPKLGWGRSHHPWTSEYYISCFRNSGSYLRKHLSGYSSSTDIANKDWLWQCPTRGIGWDHLERAGYHPRSSGIS